MKNKRLRAGLMVLGVLMFCIGIAEYSFAEGEEHQFRYEKLDNDTVRILGYEGEGKDILEIPTTLQGYEVTVIAEQAFRNRGLREVILPRKLREIEPYAFAYNKIQEIHFPDTLELIGERAFGNNRLTVLTTPASLKHIETWAFLHNDIEEVRFNEGLEKIGSGAFRGNGLRSMELPPGLIEIGSVV